MREIKFRAWDKERKEMRQIQLMDWSAWWVSTGTTWERGNTLEFGERNSFKNEKTDRHILMQFTGLKDKNGREIYEGDISKYTFHGEMKVDAIEFSAPLFTYRNSMRWSLNEDEVIGNIYENPELLEV